ncbi:4,5-DOPA dioxygenase extradiol-like [Ostrinia furnacalis]|uniref:4,5-DOPA dioxygenase extradiol-like n=1 Tax=Ostrinia furnacalis TaxID=93504 RepID=UPI00103CF31C|nr:4,5-DOPA dioxygenase extradiol-like [Ostrinia furnacalis]
MLILNTLSILLQVAFIVCMTLVSMNILRYFTGPLRKMSVIAPALFVNHGGGPLPLLGDKDHAELTKHLRDDVKKYLDLSTTKAIILVTAHWEEESVTISSGKKHSLYFDYYGFPAESYKYKYDAPGDPHLAARIQAALQKSNIKSKLDPVRGWDHGVFVPMMLINPSADIPIIQVSVLSSQDPEEHYKLGEVLYQFRKEGVAVMGSGMSYHNMREFMYGRHGKVVNEEFDQYLYKVCTAEDEVKRKEGLISWRDQPGATHPVQAAEHFMPLIVVAGAGGPKAGTRVFKWDMSNSFRLSGYVWKE